MIAQVTKAIHSEGITLISAVKDFFFDVPGKTTNLADFRREWAKLTAQDKDDLTIELKKVGYNIIPPAAMNNATALSAPPKKDDGPNYELPPVDVVNKNDGYILGEPHPAAAA